MKKLILIRFCILIVFTLAVTAAFAQVGIGNVVPDTNAILDLTNTNNRGLHLPTAPTSLPQATPGILYYDATKGILLYGTQNGYNAISPWRFKYNYSFSQNVSFTKSGNVGIGTALPLQKLHIKSNGEIMRLEGSSTARYNYFPSGFTNGSKATVGYESSNNITLIIKNANLGGNINFDMVQGNNLLVTGTVTENGYRPISPGTIVMWRSSSIPSGWAICDGTGTYINVYGQEKNIPNLQNQFVRGVANTTDQNYLVTGGEETTTLIIDQLPPHTHGAGTLNTTENGSHFHGIGSDGGSEGSSDSYARKDGENSHWLYTNSSGSHAHALSGETGYTGGTSSTTTASHSNMPPYYALYFIIKL